MTAFVYVRHDLEENLACFEFKRQYIFVSKQINKCSGINLEKMSLKINLVPTKKIPVSICKKMKRISKPHT